MIFLIFGLSWSKISLKLEYLINKDSSHAETAAKPSYGHKGHVKVHFNQFPLAVSAEITVCRTFGSDSIYQIRRTGQFFKARLLVGLAGLGVGLEKKSLT